jgi:hypothetical protein
MLQKDIMISKPFKAQYRIQDSFAVSQPNAQSDHPTAARGSHVSSKSLQMDVAPDSNLDSLKTSCQQLVNSSNPRGPNRIHLLYIQFQNPRLSRSLLLLFSHNKTCILALFIQDWSSTVESLLDRRTSLAIPQSRLADPCDPCQY